MKIYVATHKACDLPDDAGYVPIQAGCALSEADLGYLKDNTGDHISELNPGYSELTALYWIRKNTSDDKVGLVHYRRHFVARKKSLRFRGFDIAASDDFSSLGKHTDLIIATPMVMRTGLTVHDQYCIFHPPFDLFHIRRCVAERTPDYLEAFDYAMSLSMFSPFNVFVGRKVVIDAYCDWLFDLLAYMGERINRESYDAYQGRFFAFIAERLFNVWLCKNRDWLRIEYREVVQTQDVPRRKRVANWIKSVVRAI